MMMVKHEMFGKALVGIVDPNCLVNERDVFHCKGFGVWKSEQRFTEDGGGGGVATGEFETGVTT